ncbi:asparagine synthase-related protein [Actinomadura sp. 9N407]|uniref:asparagine synthase-related protein n=1 Tax=Actinomadura sp. 9N407 TaxID=3375154 RepID=UPI00379F82F5
MEFIVLPDCPAGAGIVREPAGYPEVLRHRSGRPWIVGRWAPDELTWFGEGARRVALLGCATPGDALARVRRLADLDDLARTIPGSFHLVAAVNGVVRAQGSLSTACQIFHAGAGSVTVAANRPDALARLTGAGVAAETLALRLLAPSPPYPLNERCAWEGVRALPFGTYLELDPHGNGREVPWWRAPEPETPMAQGAEQVRSALMDAVGARLRPGRTISADLSGGLDSTSLCFLLDRAKAGAAVRLKTVHQSSSNDGDDDVIWAERAASAMPGAEHVVIPARDAPEMFAGLSKADTDVETPFTRLHVRDRIHFEIGAISGLGSELHITGDGGDELFFAMPASLHTIARRKPTKWLRSMRVNRSLYRWTLRATLREMLDDRPYGKWLASNAECLTDPLPKPMESPEIGWDAMARMPAWATPGAVDTVREIIRGSGGYEPMSALRCQHAALRGVRKGGEAVRRTGRIFGQRGVALQAPYLDDRVIQAALSIRPEERAAPDRYKPALAATMRGHMPDDILARRTKAEFSQSAFAGMRRHRAEMLGLCDDMRLERLGLVNADAFRSALLGLYPNSQGLLFLLRTLSCEVWLRSLPATAPVLAQER